MTIAVTNQQNHIRLNLSQISKITKVILKHANIFTAELSLVFVDDRKIRTINRQYLNHDYATDVLSFNFAPATKPSAKSNSKFKNKNLVLTGEIIISTETALRQAEQFQTSAVYEIKLYIVHGILHLLGYDDHAPAAVRLMRAEETRLMKVLMRGRPRIDS